MVSNAHTAKQAARSVDCDVGKIVKSLVFKVDKKDTPIMFITSGKNRVDLKKVSNILKEDLVSVDANYVKQKTGFSIGGVAPFFHKEDIKIFIDKDLLKFKDVWTAAGHPKTLLNIKVKDLIKITNPEEIKVN
ncbi:MAG: YbaK/EbsC family protein [Bacillota bacterium]